MAVKLEDRDSFRKRSMAIEDLHEPKSPGWVRTPFTKNGAEKKYIPCLKEVPTGVPPGLIKKLIQRSSVRFVEISIRLLIGGN